MGQDFSFQYGPRLVCAAGASCRLAELLPGRRILFVTDARIIELGLAAPALEALHAANVEPIIFDAVESDPSLATVRAAEVVGRKAAVGAVVGFGGGSPMDVAKLVAYLLGSGDDVETLWGVDKAKGEKLPLALVPTTAGTGSEATPVTVITVDAAEKKGVSSAALMADWAVLDPALTFGLPREVTAASGIDAMVHAIEAYTSAWRKNPVSDLFARRALELLAANLAIVCDQPGNAEARRDMLLGAHFAGVAFANAPVAGVHALAYPLGGHFHVPHGVANALMLPHVLDYNMPVALTHYAELGRLICPEQENVGTLALGRAFVEKLRTLSAEASLPQRLSALGIGSEHIDLLASGAMKQERLLVNNPRPITEADARQLYEAAL
ncbi:iron-containing alcohol dehydrogenase [Sphingomonas sp. MAH-20]|uniref:Alcohol dehydrogenase 2 n=1 Tax=Sphingomonas horti TaxID=2682842 RepID=A0A6I4J1D9_9SPHN|nr:MULTISPECIES: iron-containing alcohol dehydrogenase [Sphingomonas]MBA2920586.1 iron-containing alcohol dehydrogenase [Sphingomonas sp. CGMCC 1.13658]MVO78177.1 iron-containing alcohol dehydrogenase [Sphingomonas horti]